MQLLEFLQSIEFSINESDPYLWDSFGKHARFLDCNPFKDCGVSCIFDTKTQHIYEITCYTTTNNWYRWIDPDYIEKYKKEHKSKNIKFEIACDEAVWDEIDNINDIIRKSKQVVKTGKCDDWVTVDINLDDETLLILAKKAHERDITLNQLIVESLEAFMEEHNVSNTLKSPNHNTTNYSD